MRPVVDGIEDDYGNELQVLRLDFNADPDGDVARTLGVRSHPATLLIDETGAIQHHIRGPASSTELREQVEPLLRGQ